MRTRPLATRTTVALAVNFTDRHCSLALLESGILTHQLDRISVIYNQFKQEKSHLVTDFYTNTRPPSGALQFRRSVTWATSTTGNLTFDPVTIMLWVTGPFASMLTSTSRICQAHARGPPSSSAMSMARA